MISSTAPATDLLLQNAATDGLSARLHGHEPHLVGLTCQHPNPELWLADGQEITIRAVRERTV
jgi:hypothetical protein